MLKYLLRPFFLLCAGLALTACSTAKLEARLEANPQCKDVINPKTGALMPCPGSDKAFYVAAGLAPAKTAPTVSSSTSQNPAPTSSTSPASTLGKSPLGSAAATSATTTLQTPLATDCKPQIHKKTGGMLPCPPTD